MLAEASRVYSHATAMLSSEAVAAQAASCHRAVMSMRLAHLQLAVQRVMQLQALKSARVIAALQHAGKRLAASASGQSYDAGADDSNLLRSAEVHEYVYQLVWGMLPEHGPLGACLPSSTLAAAVSTMDDLLSEPWSKPLLLRVGYTAALPSAAEGHTAAWGDLVLHVQKQVVQQVEQLGNALLAADCHLISTAGDAAAASAAADPDSARSALSGLIEKLPDVLASVEKDVATAEMAEVLQTLFKTEFRRGYGDIASFMSNHLYRCPNGHMYVIGECGGAMQRSRCPECGAAIGGAGHNLTAGNAAADQQTMQQLREAWGSTARA